MSDEGRPGRFAVPTELLRLAEAEQPATPESPDAGASPVLPARRRRDKSATPSGTGTDGDLVPAGAAELTATDRALRVAGAATTATVFVAARVALPHAQRALHVGDAGAQAVLAAAVIAGLAATPLTGRVADRRGRSRTATAALGVVVAAGALAAAAPSLTVVALLLVVAAVAGGCVLVSDLADLAGQATTYAAALPLALTVGAAVSVGLLAAGGWRLAMAGSLLGLPVVVARARRPAPPPATAEVGIGVTAQRLKRLRSALALVAVASVAGFAAVGAPVLTAAFVKHRWHRSYVQRGHILALVALGTVPGVALAGRLRARTSSRDAGELTVVIGGAAVLFGLLTGIAPLLPLGPAEAAWALSVAAATVVAVLGARAVVAVAPPAARSVALGLMTVYGVVFGGMVATVVLAAMAHANGSRVALGLAGCAAAGAGVLAAVSGPRFADDAAACGREAARAARPAVAQSAALEVHGVDFSYGARQVLFGVDLRIEEGEVSALLGTNGAGKSTLLRLVAGLDHPSAGSIHVFGRDTTFVEAEQQIGNGVAMLPGGRMSFPSLTVQENLRVGGHTIRRDTGRLRAAVDEVMDMFPILAQRRDQRVGTLSGGEQQMLALGRVLLTRPRLLLIDELSLGLAPKAVESLLAIVRRVNERGTTVLLVEQSVNLALHLAAHAIFLERGEVRFDGGTADLLRRDDLLRPIFLSAGTA